MSEGNMMQSPTLPPHPEPGSAQLDQHGSKAQLPGSAKSSSTMLAAFGVSALHHVDMSLKIRQKQ